MRTEDSCTTGNGGGGAAKIICPPRSFHIVKGNFVVIFGPVMRGNVLLGCVSAHIDCSFSFISLNCFDLRGNVVFKTPY